MTPFLDTYSRLNPSQKQAVDTIDGPVLVIAGPGSGKTQILAARIGRILLDTDVLPSNILCLTFTEAAASNMRSRLARLIGADAYGVAFHTFHSFGQEVAHQAQMIAHHSEETQVIDDIIASRWLDSILADLSWDDPYKPRMNPAGTIRDLLSTISHLKQGGVTPARLSEILTENHGIIETLSPVLTAYWQEIDALGQSKIDQARRIELFGEWADTVGSLLEKYPKRSPYESLAQTIALGIEEARLSDMGDGKSKWVTAWKNLWTDKNALGDRIWKESAKIQKQLSFLNIYTQYQDRMSREGYIDFSDMILSTIALVRESPDLRAHLAEQYQYILIDEYQDTNEAQMELILSMIPSDESRPNIFAVGDDDQSIYKFQGANTKNIRDFKDRWPTTELIILDTNYRSQSEIIEASRPILDIERHDISHIFPGAQKSFSAHRGAGGSVRKYQFSNELEEIAWITQDIREKITEGVPPHEIAVITKKNKTLDLIAKSLLSQSIPVSLSRSSDIFESEVIQMIRRILLFLDSLTVGYRAEKADYLLEILSHAAFQIPRLELWQLSRQIARARKDDNKSWIEALRTHTHPRLREAGIFLLELSRLSATTRLEDLIDHITGASSLSIPDEWDEEGESRGLQLDLWGEREKVSYISPLFLYYFGQIEYYKCSFHMKGYQHLANIRVLIEQIRSYKNGRPFLTLSDAIELLALLDQYQIRLSTSSLIGSESSSVNLVTVYKAKGLEWQHVYVPCLTDREYKMGKNTGSVLPKNLPLEPEKDDDTDRERLVYTACTRARDALTMSYSATALDEKSLTPLGSLSTHIEPWETPASGGHPQLDDILTSGNILTLDHIDLLGLPYVGEESDFLREQIEKTFVMNATALQNFLDLTSGGPTRFLSNTILRFPQAKSVAACYGSAIHKAIEVFLTDLSEKGTENIPLLYESFASSFVREGFEPAVEAEWLGRGRSTLDSLARELMSRPYGRLFLEKDFRTEGGGIWLDDIQLTGKMDCIEIIGEDQIRVTDYKTGGGFDQFDGRGSAYEKVKQWKYHLQLTFYALLFDLSPRWARYPRRQYELFFVEQDRETGCYHRPIEYIQSGEIDRMKRLVRAVMRRIRDLDFPDISRYTPDLVGIRQLEEDLIEEEMSREMK